MNRQLPWLVLTAFCLTGFGCNKNEGAREFSASTPGTNPEGAQNGAEITSAELVPGLGGPVSFASIEPYQKPIPKVDLRATLPFTHKSASIRLVGICSYVEGINCWNQNGVQNPRLELKVKELLANRSSKRQNFSVSFFIGRQNRIAVFEAKSGEGTFAVKWKTFTSPPDYRLVPQSLLDDRYLGVTDKTDGEWFHFAGFPKGKSTDSLRAVFEETLRPSSAFRPVSGEQFAIGEFRLRLVSFQPRPSGGWQFRAKIEKGVPGQLTLRVNPINADGRLIEFADVTGAPFTDAQRRSALKTYASEVQTNDQTRRPTFYQGAFELTASKDGKELMGTCRIDPKLIRELTVQGTRSVNVEFSGVPINP
jgi:hypothetical protein